MMIHRPDMYGKNILAILPQRRGAVACLEAADFASRVLQHPEIEVLHVRVPAIRRILPTEQILPREVEREIDMEAIEESRFLKKIYGNWLNTVSPRQYPSWSEEEGKWEEVLPKYSEQSALNVIARPANEDESYGNLVMRVCLFNLNTPLLVVPATCRQSDPRRIMIAWKDTRQSRKALQAAIPWLSQAGAVRLVRIGSPQLLEIEWAVSQLKEAGVSCDTVNAPLLVDETIGSQLIKEAKKMKADWIVMGAYKYGQTVERLFGGVTETLLRHSPVPLFMAR